MRSPCDLLREVLESPVKSLMPNRSRSSTPTRITFAGQSSPNARGAQRAASGGRHRSGAVEGRSQSEVARTCGVSRPWVETHPRQPAGGRSTDPDDLPADKSVYAMRDLDRLQRLAAAHGPAIGGYAAVLLDHPLPWTKMRQVYALLGLVKKWGPNRVNAACARAAEAEAFNVPLIGRMLDRGLEADAPGQASLFPPPPSPSPASVASVSTTVPARFARPAGHFAARRPDDDVRSGHKGGAA